MQRYSLSEFGLQCHRCGILGLRSGVTACLRQMLFSPELLSTRSSEAVMLQSGRDRDSDSASKRFWSIAKSQYLAGTAQPMRLNLSRRFATFPTMAPPHKNCYH